jgi:hypothetical protein
VRHVLFTLVLAVLITGAAFAQSCADPWGSTVSEPNGKVFNTHVGGTTVGGYPGGSFPPVAANGGGSPIPASSTRGFCTSISLESGGWPSPSWSAQPGCSAIWSSWGCAALDPAAVPLKPDINPVLHATFANSSIGHSYWLDGAGMPEGWGDWMASHDPADYSAWLSVPGLVGGGTAINYAAMPGAAGTLLLTGVNDVLNGMTGTGGTNPLLAGMGTTATAISSGITGTGGANSLLAGVSSSISGAGGTNDLLSHTNSNIDLVRQQLILLPDNIATAMGTKLTALFVPSETSIDTVEGDISTLKGLPPASWVSSISAEFSAPATAEPTWTWGGTFTLAGTTVPYGINMTSMMDILATYRYMFVWFFWLGYLWFCWRLFTPKTVV